MFKLKWFKGVDEAQRRRPFKDALNQPLGQFDFDSLLTTGWIARITARLLFRVVFPAVFAVLRTFKPVLRIGRLVLVARYDDVITVLENRSGYFPVVYSKEMREICGGTDFMLGQDGPEHDRIRQAVANQVLPSDIDNIREWTRRNAEALISAGRGELDVVRDLITRTATEVCCRYLGFSPQDPDTFAEWSIAVSQQLFADLTGDDSIREQSLIGATHMIAVIDNAIGRVHANNRVFALSHDDEGAEQREQRRRDSSLLDRLITFEGLDDNLVRATIMGLAVGFVPTNTLAAGNLLDELLAKPKLLREAKAAGAALAAIRRKKQAGDEQPGDEQAGDEQAALRRLEVALLNAARRNPALSPGVFRYAPAACTIDRADGRKPVTIPADCVVLASVLSALRDKSIYDTFAADPYQASWLVFGAGPHKCLGDRIGMAQIAETFAALFAQTGLVTAKSKYGEMWRAGPYPVRLDMTYDCPTREPALLVAAIRARHGVTIEQVRSAIEDLVDPDRVPGSILTTNALHANLAERMKESDCISFASVNVIEQGDGSNHPIVLIEVNGDGSNAHVLEAFAAAGGEPLSRLLALCSPDGAPPVDPAAASALMLSHVLDLKQSTKGTMGLHFNGLPGLTVADIARQERLVGVVRWLIDRRMRNPGLSEGRAMELLESVRRLLKRDTFYLRIHNYRDIMAGLDDALSYAIVRPSRQRLQIADWKPGSTLANVWQTIKAANNRSWIRKFGLFSLLCGVPWYLLALPHGVARWWQHLLALAAGLAGGAVTGLVLAAIAFGLFLLLVRRAEKNEPSDPRIADYAHVQAIARLEDQPGIEQNHIIALMPFKRGWIRRYSFAFSMWWIREAVSHWFRPGFVATMGTIHKARWFLVPGTRQFVFNSNYDGTWESYLEDFITRVHEGQSSSWSHGEGFPPTRFLVFDGAADGDRFKRWVRRQQRPSLCWYSRFPHLTTRQIRNNALIEDGLARAASDTDARRWLAQFGSAQREVDELESHEAQSIVFSGLPEHRIATLMAVRLPEDSAAARDLVRDLTGLTRPPLNQRTAKPAKVQFGDRTVDSPGLVLGLTADGLHRLGLKNGRGLDQLPAAFRMGMHGRYRLLGDHDADGHSKAPGWRWSDNPADPRNGVDAVIVVYTRTRHEHAKLVEAHREQLTALGGKIIHETACSPVVQDSAEGIPIENSKVEHFGFRDGISQPVIRGSRKSGNRPAARDVVAAGEFLMGYRNDQGYVSPSVAIGAEHDPGSRLPTVAEYDPNRFPYYGNHSSQPDLRDFGRNSSFLVLRQLDQDVAGFHAGMQAAAAKLTTKTKDGGGYSDLPARLGHPVDAEWVKAKVIGRWPNGSPLIGNTNCPGREVDHPDNDFAYGVDDPRGLACPLGSHIRRTNPRDSLEPGDPEEQAITNRHRILRRGRSYQYTPNGETTEVKGLLFAAICSDLERQFEFVQHTWVNASSFHGLSDEADPLLGNPMVQGDKFVGQGTRASRNTRFTIPTPAGPVVVEGMQSYVEMKAGGYFMLPSRSALRYLCSLRD